MYHPISSKIENYSAPDRWLQFMYSNLELFWVKRPHLCTAAEGQIVNRSTVFTPALLGSKLTSAQAAVAKSPSKQMLKNSFALDFSLGCEVRGGIHQEFLAALPKYSWTLPAHAHQPKLASPQAPQIATPPCSNPWLSSNNHGEDILWQTVGCRHRHH